jgi:endonuclease YncB( thermonuclease family)
MARSGGLKWALGILVLTLFPRVVGGTVRRLTGGSGGHHPPDAFQGGGPGNQNKNLWGSMGRFLTGVGAKAALATAVASMAVGVSIAPPGTFQHYHTVGEIPSLAFRQQSIVVGKVVRVSDGDTIRVRHTPLFPLLGNTPDSGRLTEETLIIRLAGIDAPETAKGTGKGQPFAEESKRFVINNVLHQKVQVKLLSRDQYARAVCSISYGPFSSVPFPLPSFLKKDLSAELLKEGLAVVYRQRGAQYDGMYREMEGWEAQAKMKRKGIWSKKGEVELPHQYKARAKMQEAERTLAPQGA